MNHLNSMTLDKKVLISVCFLWIIRLIAPSSILITLFGLDWHLSEGALYPFLNYMSINLILGLSILLMMTLIAFFVDSLLMLMASLDFKVTLKIRLDWALGFLIELSGIIASWLCIILGIYSLLRGDAAIEQIVLLLFLDSDNLRHPVVLMFILFVLYSLKNRFIKLDLLDLAIRAVDVDVEEEVEEEDECEDLEDEFKR